MNDTTKKLALEALDQIEHYSGAFVMSKRPQLAIIREALSTPAAADAQTFEQWYSKRYQYDFSAKPETWKHAAMCDAREVWDAAKASAPEPVALTDEQVRELFEASVKKSAIASKTPLNIVTLNGAFHHYFDADTDTMWLGYRAGYRRAALAASQPAPTPSKGEA
ncbi:hypothetical protein [Chryseobacterium sp.]|uniref:hypothetical protein n=1 Tax=Chryseobacterium sp. TaxID=1871047 RepID=UPI00321BF67C